MSNFGKHGMPGRPTIGVGGKLSNAGIAFGVLHVAGKQAEQADNVTAHLSLVWTGVSVRKLMNIGERHAGHRLLRLTRRPSPTHPATKGSPGLLQRLSRH